MAKYLIHVSYTKEGIRRLAKDGGSKRKKVAEELMGEIGGKVEAFYFCFGDDDAIVIVDAPDNVSVVAVSLAVNASDAVSIKTTVLLTPEEMDKAAKMQVSYSAPGS